MGEGKGDSDELEQFRWNNIRILNVGVPIGFGNGSSNTSSDEGCCSTLGDSEEGKLVR